MNEDAGGTKPAAAGEEQTSARDPGSTTPGASTPGKRPEFYKIAVALIIGTAGGAAASWLGLPLAWMIGAMVFTTIA